MMQQLYAFGFPHADKLNVNDVNTPDRALATRTHPLLRAKSLRVLWASWCDVIVTHSGDDVPRSWHLQYAGTGLCSAQQEHVCSAGELKSGGGALCDGGDDDDDAGLTAVTFFGDAMHHGLRGYLLTETRGGGGGGTTTTRTPQYQTIILFPTDPELENGVPPVQTYPVHGDWPEIAAIKMLSDDSLLLGLQQQQQPPPLGVRRGGGTGSQAVALARVKNPSQLRDQVSSSSPLSALQRLPPTFTSSHHSPCDVRDTSTSTWASNATTTTMLDADKHVWTWSSDARYEPCLGRPYDAASDLGPVPYLSETRMEKVVAGGYMSAALSAQGELFLWGQACPGSEGELSVLRRLPAHGHGPTTTGITTEGEQDEFVKCLVVYIDGNEARVYDVAIGHGHVLVAAETGAAQAAKTRAVFAAGDNARGQLGLAAKGFHPEFIEVIALRGKRIAQLSAAGWSSFVVTCEE